LRIQLGRVAALEEVRLSKISEITRPGFVEICRPRRAFLQFLHPNHAQSPLACVCSALFLAAVSWLFGKLLLSKKIAACAKFYWATGQSTVQLVAPVPLRLSFDAQVNWQKCGAFFSR
jgi:hypothetical protein